MANSTYDRRWQEAMTELNEQIHLEDHTLRDDFTATSKKPVPPHASIVEAFQHYAGLYITYIQILSRLSECYDHMIHPQKRIDVKQVMEVVATRVVELKHLLVKWNPPNSDVSTQPERSFPWEYVNFDDLLVDRKLPPETIEIPISPAFLDDQREHLVRRDRLVKGYMKLRHGVDSIQLDAMKQSAVSTEVGVLSLDEAIAVIQKNERGRQGRQRGLLVEILREQERHSEFYQATLQGSFELDPGIAAAKIQRMFRGSWSRGLAARARDAELVFIGMKAPTCDRSAQDQRLADARLQRRSEQLENKEDYERALVELHGVVASEEGPFMKEQMLEERRRWITDVMATGQIPADLSGFYAAVTGENSVEKTAVVRTQEKAARAKAATRGATVAKEDKKGGRGATGKGKAVKIQPLKAIEIPPWLTGPSELCTKLAGCVAQYNKGWRERREMDNFYQKYDVGLAKEVVRGPVEAQVCQQVDALLKLQLMNIKTQLGAATVGKREKKGKATKDKGTHCSKERGKKSLLLPGDKIAELKDQAPDSFLSVLVDHEIVHAPRPGVHVCDFIGSFNLLGTTFQHLNCRDQLGHWVPQDPSAAQLRQLITEYGILPLSSPNLRARTPLIRSLLLYGPRGSGKTLLVSALANDSGALLLNLSPRNLTGKFPGKSGPTKLVHMAFMLAKATTFQPIVIYIDECEQVFAEIGNRTRATSFSEEAARFKKDLLLYIKTALDPSDRVLIVGTSADPGAADAKDLRAFFDKFLYVPYPDYASRILLWKHTLRSTIAAQAAKLGLPSAATVTTSFSSSGLASSTVSSQLQDLRGQHALDISLLGHISEGYASGSIVRAVKITLTPRRVECLNKRLLREAELLGALSHQPATVTEDFEKFQTFTALITGLKETRNKIRKAAIEALHPDDKKDTKGKGTKKGKKGKE